MKKLIILLILAMFFVISCGSSKKAENNDTDILPDEDVTDADENQEDEEETDNDEDELENIDPCDPNPCAGLENSTEECIADADKYSCRCVDSYFWDGKKCVDPCSGISCSQFDHASGTCEPKDAFSFSCDCEEGFWWWKDKGCIAQKHTAANVCTGQTKCYDNEKEIPCPTKGEEFYGQDAQYAKLGYCVPQSFSIDYSVKDEPVVIDNNTGNMWQRNIAPVETRYSGDEYCSDLVYGGYDDWTLPSVGDFMTIADYGRYDPAVNTEYFPDTGLFWTASRGSYTDIGERYYTVYYYTEIFDFKDSSAHEVTTFYHNNAGMGATYCYGFDIRCLRRNSVSAAPYYFISKTFGNSMMWNNYNDLIFMKKTGKELSWSEALEYCLELNYAGISDWRLPNVKELALNSKDGVHSSTTALYDFNYAYAHQTIDDSIFRHITYRKDYKLKETFCVANDPCESKKFWNGEKCAKNPCLDDPCKSDSNSDGICMVLDEETYSCNCKQSYKWSPQKLQCVHTCLGNPCSTYSNSDKQCYDDDVEGFYCGCIEPYFWNANSRKCTQNCDHNPCLNEANSTHECFPDEKNGYTCGCNDGYVWLRLDGCVTDFCKLDSCKNIPNSSGECRIVEEFGYLCECLNGTLWNPIEKNCGDEGFSFDWGTE